jgi:hypothetical protein
MAIENAWVLQKFLTFKIDAANLDDDVNKYITDIFYKSDSSIWTPDPNLPGQYWYTGYQLKSIVCEYTPVIGHIVVGLAGALGGVLLYGTCNHIAITKK